MTVQPNVNGDMAILLDAIGCAFPKANVQNLTHNHFTAEMHAFFLWMDDGWVGGYQVEGWLDGT